MSPRRPDLGDKIKAALGSQGTLSHNSFYRAGASHQPAALMLEIRAQNVPWSPRQPLLALESTRREACKGRRRLWTSTLTEPLQLESYFKNGNEVPRGSCQAHARRWACLHSRSPRVNDADLHQEPAGPWNNRSLETTTARARDGHGTTSFCVVWCRTTPWCGTAGMRSTLLCAMLRTPGCDLVSSKSRR